MFSRRYSSLSPYGRVFLAEPPQLNLAPADCSSATTLMAEVISSSLIHSRIMPITSDVWHLPQEGTQLV